MSMSNNNSDACSTRFYQLTSLTSFTSWIRITITKTHGKRPEHADVSAYVKFRQSIYVSMHLAGGDWTGFSFCLLSRPADL